MRDPLLPQVDGIHVPGSRPILSDTFHRVPSNRLVMPLLLPFVNFFFVSPSLLDGDDDDDKSSSSSFIVLVKKIGVGGGSSVNLSTSSFFFAAVVAMGIVSGEEVVAVVEMVVVVVEVNFSLNSSNRRKASFFNSLISSRSLFDSASISDTVLVPLLSIMPMTFLLKIVLVGDCGSGIGEEHTNFVAQDGWY